MAKKGAPVGNRNAAGPRSSSRLVAAYQGAKGKAFQHATENAHVGKAVHSGSHAVGGAMRALPVAAAVGGGAYLAGNAIESPALKKAGALIGTTALALGASKAYAGSKAGKQYGKLK